MLDRALRNRLCLTAGNQTFVKRQVDIRQGDFPRRSRQTPAAGVTAFRHKKSRLAQTPQHAADDDRVCSRMRGNVGGRSDALRLSGHVTEGVKGQGQAAVAFQEGLPILLRSVTETVADIQRPR